MTGLVATLALLGLGFAWPSLYTALAVFALPAALLLVVSVVRPAMLREHPRLRGYVVLSVAVAVGSWLVQLVWLTL